MRMTILSSASCQKPELSCSPIQQFTSSKLATAATARFSHLRMATTDAGLRELLSISLLGREQRSTAGQWSSRLMAIGSSREKIQQDNTIPVQTLQENVS